ncbi:cytochrome P450 [Plectosphaerella plurivora]|uniref:Cytochrome P450 n=1 Tax=Plectosphaerella plurivora TaxID=936078 RepID=A0A9P8VDB8_9PEZI|nr:cytochrome P450 [Plectosphaerella plurivora]
MAVAENARSLTWTSAIAAVPLIWLALARLVSPTFDPREPPPLWPTFPIIGHIVSILREAASFYPRLLKEKGLPILSLPVVNKKIYVISSPGLIAAAMKNPDLTFEPFLLELSAGAIGMTQKHRDIVSRDGNIDKGMDLTRLCLKGQPLAKLNVAALDALAEPLHAIDDGQDLVVPDVWNWIRDVLGQGISKSLFGEKNPLTKELFADISVYEAGLPLLARGYDLFVPKSVAARKRIVTALQRYYTARHDEDETASDFVRGRASHWRQAGATDEDVGVLELTTPWAGSTNTVPSCAWFFLNIFSRPDLVARIRAEVEAFSPILTSEDGTKKCTMDVVKLESSCPVLGAAYRETLRIYQNNLGMRRVVRDTTLRDPADGREYLLREGVDVHWQSLVTHTLPTVWGETWQTFDPERFLDVPLSEEKKRRGASIPFGGGKHLCPGRHFALVENLGFVAMLAAGFDIEGVLVPDSKDPIMGIGSRRPVWGTANRSIRVRRRQGWKGVTWSFA